jgi:hypothetical protein
MLREMLSLPTISAACYPNRFQISTDIMPENKHTAVTYAIRASTRRATNHRSRLSPSVGTYLVSEHFVFSRELSFAKTDLSFSARPAERAAWKEIGMLTAAGREQKGFLNPSLDRRAE